MTTELPPNVGFGTVKGRIVTAEQTGTGPVDSVPVQGTVIFTPQVDALLNITAQTIILPKPVIVTLDDGYFETQLVATDDLDNNPARWHYGVSFNLVGVKYRAFQMDVPEGSIIDLSNVAPVYTGSLVVITRGPAGPGGTGPAGPAGPAGTPASDATVAGFVTGPGPTATAIGAITATKVGKGDLVYNVKDYGAVGNGTANDTAAIEAAIVAANAASSLYLVPVVWFPAGTFLTDAIDLGTRRVVFQGAGAQTTIIKARTGQTDYLVKAGTSWGAKAPNNLWRPRMGGFRLQGTSAAAAAAFIPQDATAPHPGGMKLDNIGCIDLYDIAFREFGGPNLWLCNVVLSRFSNLALNRPSGANTNAVPYFYSMGWTNENKFQDLLFQSLTATADGPAVVLIDTMAGASMNQGAWHGTQFEFQHTPDNGAIWDIRASTTMFSDSMYEDCVPVAGASAVGTSIMRFRANGVGEEGANRITGVIPGNKGNYNRGILLEQNGNVVDGSRGYLRRNVEIGAGVNYSTIKLSGAEGALTSTYADSVVDNSGTLTNVVIDTTQGVFRVNRPMVTKTASYTVLPADDTIIANGASVTISLPSAVTAAPGRTITVKNINAVAAVVNSPSAGTVDGAASVSLAQWVSGTFRSNGTNWLRFDTGAGESDANVASYLAGVGPSATALQAAIGSVVRGVDGHNYRIVGGPIRNDGPPNYWQPVTAGAHAAQFIDTITTSTSDININYASAGGVSVVTLLITPDEILQREGIIAGGSVGTTFTSVQMSQEFRTYGDYISWNGSAFVSSTGLLVPTWASPDLKLTHATYPSHTPASVLFDIRVSGRASAVTPYLSDTSPTQAGLDSFYVKFKDPAGVVITTPTTACKFFGGRGGGRYAVNPQLIDTVKYPLSNMWVIGIMRTD